MTSPPHHRPDGRFRNPWPGAAEDDPLRRQCGRVVLEWLTTSLLPDPPPNVLPAAHPDPAVPRTAPGEMRITWVGHATHLIQLHDLNVLTDPMWSARPSPIASLGTKRFVPAVPDLAELPRVDAVLLSHDHYDHLDRPTVIGLRDRFGSDLRWYTPLGYRSWFSRLGVENVVELDWWDGAEHPGSALRVVATPTRHWTRLHAAPPTTWRDGDGGRPG